MRRLQHAAARVQRNPYCRKPPFMYPMVYPKIAMLNISWIFNGKISYFYGHFQALFFYVYQAGYFTSRFSANCRLTPKKWGHLGFLQRWIEERPERPAELKDGRSSYRLRCPAVRFQTVESDLRFMLVIYHGYPLVMSK